MNLYLLVEGISTEMYVYPAWLEVLLPDHSRIDSYMDAGRNNWLLISGGGHPQLLGETLRNAIAELRESDRFDYLIVCLDADDETPEAREREVRDAVQAFSDDGFELPSTVFLRPIVQNCCIETWFLGNRTLFPRNPQDAALRDWIEAYDVSRNCPEAMPGNSVHPLPQHLHLEYFRKICLERNVSYSKTNSATVRSRTFLDELIRRVEETSHLPSLKEFLDLCHKIRTHPQQSAG